MFKNSKKERRASVLVFAVIMFLGAPVWSATIFVDARVTTSGDGTSWATAKKTITEALDLATSDSEIRVAEGTYRESISLKSNVALYGGFTGAESVPAERDLAVHLSIIDAGAVNILEVSDIHFDGFVINGGGISLYSAKGANRIENCAIVGNNSDGTGGGLSAYNSQAVFKNCNIIGNRARTDSQGIYFTHGCGVTLFDHCIISGNNGDGILIYVSEPATFQSCVIFGNGGCGVLSLTYEITLNGCLIGYNGGGGIKISNGYTLMKLLNCVICGNTADEGAGLKSTVPLNTNPYPLIVNCTFANNRAQKGGGVYCSGSKPRFVNTIFSNNAGHAIYEANTNTEVGVVNCLFHNNPDGDLFDEGSTSYTGAEQINQNVTGASANISGDPLFVAGPTGAWTHTPTLVHDYGLTCTLLTDANASFTPGALAGRLINVDTRQNWIALILNNTRTTITVLTDATGYLASGESYRIIDYHLGFSLAAGSRYASPSIDAGAATDAPATDFDGRPRPFDIPGFGADSTGTEYDIGVYEAWIRPNSVRMKNLRCYE